jgi:hypothetical protein
MTEAMRDSTNVYFAKLARDAEVGLGRRGRPGVTG